MHFRRYLLTLQTATRENSRIQVANHRQLYPNQKAGIRTPWTPPRSAPEWWDNGVSRLRCILDNNGHLICSRTG